MASGNIINSNLIQTVDVVEYITLHSIFWGGEIINKLKVSVFY